jgi:UDP-glucose 4-epimerase
MNRFVVTGGAGFIGSALVRKLLAEGAGRVTVVDNFLTGKWENLAEVAPNIDLREADIREFGPVLDAFRGAEVVFHLAAIPSVPRSIADPVPSHEVNINGAFQVFRAAVEAGVRRLVYAASSSAYGDTETLPKSESMAPRPKSPYAVQKLVGEYYAAVFASCFQLETVSLRFFNVYGPRQDPSSQYSGVISRFMSALIQREPPTIFGDGEQSRDFTYVEDVTELVWKAAFAPGVSGRTYNAGNGNRYTLNQVWQTLQAIEGVSLPPRYAPPRAGDVRDSQADTTLARRDLGHQPRFSLEEGLRRTLAWYKEHAPAFVA